MDYYSHAIISARKFNCNIEDTLPLHKIMDKSKMYYQGWQHRMFSHNTFFIDTVVELYGDIVQNTKVGGHILTRDILMEHCKEDFSGKVPSIENWLDCIKFNTKETWINNPDRKRTSMAKRIKDKDNRILVKELDAILQEDKIVQIGYFSGGDDSGGCDFNNNLEKLSHNSYNHLHYLCNDSLDYGGWNGSFSASGDIYYDPINKTIEIEGSELNHEVETTSEIKEIDISGFKRKYFEGLRLAFDNFDEIPFVIEAAHNFGVTTPDLEEEVSILERKIKDIVEDHDYYEGFRVSENEFLLSDSLPDTFKVEIRYHEDTEISKIINL